MKLTPQQKKRLSLLRDRRNTHGESPHGARVSIPRQKRLRARRERLALKPDAADLDDMATAEAALVRRKAWWKAPDSPLVDVIAAKFDRRAKTGQNRLE